MDQEKRPPDDTPSRDDLAAEIRRFRYQTWGTKPTPDSRWECFFDTVATRGGNRLRTYGSHEIDAMERMVEVLVKEGIERS